MAYIDWTEDNKIIWKEGPGSRGFPECWDNLSDSEKRSLIGIIHGKIAAEIGVDQAQRLCREACSQLLNERQLSLAI